jgi:pyruvate/2-oxoglutarate dehydrogenase complex dihydrolipoamide dehydrogenase (E3) component
MSRDYDDKLSAGRDPSGDRLLVAAGRRLRIEGIGLETLGVEATSRQAERSSRAGRDHRHLERPHQQIGECERS